MKGWFPFHKFWVKITVIQITFPGWLSNLKNKVSAEQDASYFPDILMKGGYFRFQNSLRILTLHSVIFHVSRTPQIGETIAWLWIFLPLVLYKAPCLLRRWARKNNCSATDWAIASPQPFSVGKSEKLSLPSIPGNEGAAALNRQSFFLHIFFSSLVLDSY